MFRRFFRWLKNVLLAGPPPEEYRLEEARQAAARGSGEQMAMGLDSAREIARAAQEAGGSVETKAQNLIAFAGLLAGLAVSVLALVASKDEGISDPSARAVVMVGFAVGTILLVFSIIRAFQTVRIGRGKTYLVSPLTPLEFLTKNLVSAKREWLASLVCAATNNFRVVQWQADALRRGQTWLFLAIVFTVLSMVVAVVVLVVQGVQASPPIQPAGG